MGGSGGRVGLGVTGGWHLADSQSIGGVTEGKAEPWAWCSQSGQGSEGSESFEHRVEMAVSEDGAGECSRGDHSAVVHSRHSTEMV